MLEREDLVDFSTAFVFSVLLKLYVNICSFHESLLEIKQFNESTNSLPPDLRLSQPGSRTINEC